MAATNGDDDPVVVGRIYAQIRTGAYTDTHTSVRPFAPHQDSRKLALYTPRKLKTTKLRQLMQALNASSTPRGRNFASLAPSPCLPSSLLKRKFLLSLSNVINARVVCHRPRISISLAWNRRVCASWPYLSSVGCIHYSRTPRG